MILFLDLISDFVENARSELQLIFTQLLFEDVVAADFLLCHLISRVYIRNDEHTLGKFSLNLCNVKHKDFGTCLNSILQIIVTNSHYIPLSIQMLNDSNFVPKCVIYF